MINPCSCETVPERKPLGRQTWIDVTVTTHRLLDRIRSGDMVLLRADCPLEQTLAIVEAESRYTLRHYLLCRRCDRTVLFGVCIRGMPVYRYAEADEPVTDMWEESATFVDTIGGPVKRYGVR